MSMMIMMRIAKPMVSSSPQYLLLLRTPLSTVLLLLLFFTRDCRDLPEDLVGTRYHVIHVI